MSEIRGNIPLRDIRELSEDMREGLRGELRESEQLLWWAQPDPRRLARLACPLIIFGLFMLGFAVLWLQGLIDFGGSEDSDGGGGGFFRWVRLAFAVSITPVVLVGLGCLTAPYWVARRARRTLYIVTDRRAVILLVGRSTKVASFEPSRLTDLPRVECPDGTGDVLFGSRFSFYGPQQLTSQPRPGFFGIDRPKDVEALLKSLVERAGQSAASGAVESEFEIPRDALGSRSANFRPIKLVRTSGDRVESRMTASGKVFWAMFLIVGSVIFCVFSRCITKMGGGIEVLGILASAMGAGFALLGLLGLLGKLGGSPITLDRRQGRLWTRRRKFGPKAHGEGLPLDEIVAVQICSHPVRDSESSYIAYELNLVLHELSEKGSRRVTVTSHAKESALRADAKALAEFLGVELLDHSG